MTTDPKFDSTAIVPTPDDLPSKDTTAKRETRALIDAIKKRAQAEVQAVGNVTRDTYLEAVRNARASIEKTKFVDRDRVDHSIRQIEHEAEKNWHSVAAEIESFGSRLSDAAKAAWDKLTERREK